METQETARLWRAGRSAGQIASTLNRKFEGHRTRNIVMGKLNRMGLLGTRSAKAKRRASKARSSVADVLAGMAARSGKFGKAYPLPPDEPIPSTAVTLEERQPHQCAWPVNQGGPFLFCGARKSAHHAFCNRHAKASTAAPRPSQRQLDNYVNSVAKQANRIASHGLDLEERLCDKPWRINRGNFIEKAQ